LSFSILLFFCLFFNIQVVLTVYSYPQGKLRKLVAYENAPRDPESSRPIPPEIDMEFENEDKAYEFYNKYAGLTGFSVCKGWIGKISSRMI
jgi:zinc finger SWIM domain-containing protein 3